MKIVVQGLAFNGPGSYLKGGWNILDLFVVIVGILVLILEAVLDASNVIWLRVVRAMRWGAWVGLCASFARPTSKGNLRVSPLQ